MGTLVGSAPSKFRISAASVGDAAAALQQGVLALGDDARDILWTPHAVASATGPAIWEAAGFTVGFDAAGDLVALAPLADKLPGAVADLEPVLSALAAFVADGSTLAFTEDDSVVTFTFRGGAVSCTTKRRPRPRAKKTTEVLLGATAARVARLARKPWLVEVLIGSAELADVSPLAALANLTSLTLDCPRVADIAPLAALVRLETLRLRGTAVADLSPLRGLAHLTTLDVTSSPVVDLAPLRDLRALTLLDIESAPVTDLSPLASLTNLVTLVAKHVEHVADWSPLAACTRLSFLNAPRAGLRDSHVLRALRELTALHVRDNVNLREIEGLRENTVLESIDLQGTGVVDLSPLAAARRAGTLRTVVVSAAQLPSIVEATPPDVLASLREIETFAAR